MPIVMETEMVTDMMMVTGLVILTTMMTATTDDGVQVVMITTMAAATTAIVAGTDIIQLKMAADKKPDIIRCDPIRAYYC